MVRQSVSWVITIACLCFISASSPKEDPGLLPALRRNRNNEKVSKHSLRRHPPEVLTRLFLKAPCAPSCPAASDILAHATLSGLVPGARYNVVFFVKHALRLVHVSAKQVTRESSHEAWDLPPRK